ncbi:phage tail assembly chaperone [Bacillus chungangensis]|uniref:Phage portal protein n=1 Tax=Bacillus chungangensis TaxID=587633 RepID=A0ABT9WRQ8_9BACI|nr:phage portal protein [Bacillus chungangensis]MDQ0175987.1 hypothetical protein [Bacillus chungangensis]
MSDLQAFFAQNVQAEITEEFVISDRFKDENGKPIPWKLRGMDEIENEEIRKSATKRKKVKGRGYVTEIDDEEYINKLMVASVVYPNLKDAELQKSYGVIGAGMLLKKMLLSGEYGELAEKVKEINGYDKDMEDLKDEAKN